MGFNSGFKGLNVHNSCAVAMQFGVIQMPNTVATQVTNIQMKISGMREFYMGKQFKNKVKSFPAAVPILDSNRTCRKRAK